MPPSLEVEAHHHHQHQPHHQGANYHMQHQPQQSLDFDDAILKASGVEEELDITETESSENVDIGGGNGAAKESSSGTPPASADGTNIIDGQDWNHITKPGTHDVLLGRGGGTNNHAGNIRFRKLVNEHKMRYLACSKVEKPKVARQVVGIWRKMEPTGRFLARKETKGSSSANGGQPLKAGSDNVWFEVGDKKAREKASQCLRERTPDVIPYIKHLREQQNAITEQGVSMVQMQMQQQEQMLHVPPGHHAGGMPTQGGAHHAHMGMMGHPSSMHPHHQQHPHHQHPHAHAAYSGFDPNNSHSPYGAPPAYARRNSMPNPHHQALPGVAPMGTNQFFPSSGAGAQQQQQQRRNSVEGIMAVGSDCLGAENGTGSGGAGDMSEVEYQQQMMLMQQTMMQQQMQMQRMQQTRHMRNMQSSGGGPSPYNMMPPAPGAGDQPQPLYQGSNDLAGSPPSATTGEGEVTNSPASTTKNKRGRDDGDKPSAPDRTTSLMSLTPANVGADDHELSLEDYRQQLEEYIANTNKDDNGNGGGDNNDNDDGNASDLEDDWEKERERALRQHGKGRGVNRNVSGMSCLSKSSGMSLVSGFSGFSDMNMSKKSEQDGENGDDDEEQAANRETKMNMARSVSSNLSLMSELTDLSQNIDNLSIYDD